MQITDVQVRELGRLARVELTDREVDALVEQLPKIVDYVSQLQAIDAPRIVGDDTAASLRDDEVQPSLVRDQILGQAPERNDDFWKVDAVFS